MDLHETKIATDYYDFYVVKSKKNIEIGNDRCISFHVDIVKKYGKQ